MLWIYVIFKNFVFIEYCVAKTNFVNIQAINNLLRYGKISCDIKLLRHAKFSLDRHDDNNSRGCVLEIDFEYSEELHEFHNDDTLAPDKMFFNNQLTFKNVKK